METKVEWPCLALVISHALSLVFSSFVPKFPRLLVVLSTINYVCHSGFLMSGNTTKPISCRTIASKCSKPLTLSGHPMKNVGTIPLTNSRPSRKKRGTVVCPPITKKTNRWVRFVTQRTLHCSCTVLLDALRSVFDNRSVHIWYLVGFFFC